MPQMLSFPGNAFPFGTHVYREPHQDQDELMADLPLLKKLGFNMIKIQEHWGIDEPREGEVDLSRIERIMAQARKLELGVYLGLTMEQAPAWVWRKYPDCRMVYADGRIHNDPTQYCLPADGKPGPCWDHPGVRAAGERFIAALAQRLGRFDNLWCWNTWQEIGFWPNDSAVLGMCYCPHTLTRFRDWLRAKYDTLEALNRTWQCGFGDWAEVEPPRRSPFAPPFIDWRYFMDNVYISRALEWKTRALRENDPRKRPVFSHLGGPYIGAGADWRWAKVGDFHGCSNYPAWGPFHGWDDAFAQRADKRVTTFFEMWNAMMFRCDYVRSATGRDRPFWGAEFQGGPISTHLHKGRTPKAEDIRRWMLSGLAAGMNGISFWNHRCEISWQECNGFGLLDPEGDTTERIEEAARIGRAVNEAPEVFSLGQPPRAQVAILVNDDLYHFCQGTQNDPAGHLYASLRGHYYRLWKMGLCVDFVEAEDVAQGALAGYKVAIQPVSLALDAAHFKHITRFVANGGMLITDACPGRFDKYGFCPREQMVRGGRDVFGAKHRDVRIVREPDGGRKIWTPDERGWGEFAPPTVLEGANDLAGTRLRASFYLQTLEPTSATPILMAGTEVAGTLNRYKKGWAALVGTFGGHSALSHPLEGREGVYETLLDRAGVTPDRCGALLRRRRVWQDQEAWFFINPTDKTVRQTVPLDGATLVRDLLGDTLVKTSKASLQIKVPAVSVGCVVVRKPST
ncbi:MAG: hypothetical protein A3K19_04935 [Lentisphaerae bacterium RIFOXYB12_FULL_65_16]|nr:MAG: hypothetical protein A3K18_35125 [Lentisphaerae bacterium RIFOXYA12_64_32]OGV89736.1 MAG: hypothetical protein A3K19_04935 [Lentisphaerae bacterium RIFOXYB12_FULL_65_16]